MFGSPYVSLLCLWHLQISEEINDIYSQVFGGSVKTPC